VAAKSLSADVGSIPVSPVCPQNEAARSSPPASSEHQARAVRAAFACCPVTGPAARAGARSVHKQSFIALTTRCKRFAPRENSRGFRPTVPEAGQGQGESQLQGMFQRRRGVVPGTIWHLRHSCRHLSVHVQPHPACYSTCAPRRVCWVAASVRTQGLRSQRNPLNFRGHGGRAGARPGFSRSQRPHRLPEQPSPVAPPRPRPRSRGMAREEEVSTGVDRPFNSILSGNKYFPFRILKAILRVSP
jgi:hypothetical protein